MYLLIKDAQFVPWTPCELGLYMYVTSYPEKTFVYQVLQRELISHVHLHTY